MLPGFLDMSEGRKMLEDENNKKGLRPLVNKAFEKRTKSANTGEESTITNTPMAALRSRSKATPGSQHLQRPTNDSKPTSPDDVKRDDMKSIFYYRHNQSQRFEKTV